MIYNYPIYYTQDQEDPRTVKVTITRATIFKRFSVDFVTPGSPTVITAAGHTIEAGDYVHLIIQGMASLNDKNFVVTAVDHTDNDTFTVAADSSLDNDFHDDLFVEVYAVNESRFALTPDQILTLRNSPDAGILDDIAVPYVEGLLPTIEEQDAIELIHEQAGDPPTLVTSNRDISTRFQ